MEACDLQPLDNANSNNGSTVMMHSDNPMLQKIFGKYFLSRGYNFLPLADTTAIMNTITQKKPDVILAYITANQSEDVDTIRIIRNQAPLLPIIVISDNIEKKHILSLRNYSISGIFVKPFELKKLEEKIQSIINSKNANKFSLLLISENENLKDELTTFLPQNIIEKQDLKILIRTSCNDSISALKKPQNQIRIILVDASNESKTLILAQVLKIIVTKLQIPVYFIADDFSQHFQNSLIKLGFINLISRSGSSANDFNNMFESVITNVRDGSKAIATQERRNIIRDLKAIKTLPPLPEIYFKVEELAKNPNATSADYSKILELDTGITARLFRMSNSAFFAFNRKINSVKDAVALMGTREIVSLVRLACITGNLKVSPEIESSVKKVWEHSAICAIAAQLIYEEGDIKEKNQEFKESLFISGIIHDIGKIILWKFFPDIYLPVMLNPDFGSDPTISDEKKYLGISHCDVGKSLADHWQLPETFRNVIAYHHTPTLRPESDLVMIIHISNIVSKLIMNDLPEGKDIGLDPEIKKIGYNESKIRELTDDLESSIRERATLALRMITG
ncbi:MAG: HDOD domain-containing protein [Candidatus Latescibacteria bacterium]|nr:HDOD domain-containing protein [Candidatus Latescibacterota bacterium]